MWARVMEFMLACWLIISLFIFRYTAEDQFIWMSDTVCACLVALFALLSFWDPLRKIHLLTLGVALWLLGVGYRAFPALASIPEENSMAVGLLLSMLSIVPCHAHLLSRSWQEFDNKG